MKIKDRFFLPNNDKTVHAASIEYWNNHFVYSWFGGSTEGAQDVCISIYNLNDKKEFIRLGDRDPIPRWNPVLFNYDNNLFLFEKVGLFCDRWQTIIHNITNWNESKKENELREKQQYLPAGLNGPVKNRPIVAFQVGADIESTDPFTGKVIMCGSSCETIFDWTSYIENYKQCGGEFEVINRSNPL